MLASENYASEDDEDENIHAHKKRRHITNAMRARDGAKFKQHDAQQKARVNRQRDVRADHRASLKLFH